MSWGGKYWIIFEFSAMIPQILVKSAEILRILRRSRVCHTVVLGAETIKLWNNSCFEHPFQELKYSKTKKSTQKTEKSKTFEQNFQSIMGWVLTFKKTKIVFQKKTKKCFRVTIGAKSSRFCELFVLWSAVDLGKQKLYFFVFSF